MGETPDKHHDHFMRTTMSWVGALGEFRYWVVGSLCYVSP